MKSAYVPHVNSLQFPECWDHAAKTLTAARRSRLTETLVDPLGHLIFLAEALFITWGLLYTHVDLPVLKTFFRDYPAFTQAWASFSGNVLHALPLPDILPVFVWELIISLVLALAVPMALCLLLAGFVRLLFHPRPEPLPQGDEGQHAVSLLSLVRKIQRIRIKPRIQASGLSSCLYLLISLVIGAFLLLDYLENPTLDIPDFVIAPGFSAIAVGLFLAYGAGDYLLLLLLRRLYRYGFSREFAEEVKAYVRQTLPAEDAEALLALPLKQAKGLQRLKEWALKSLPRPRFLEQLLDKTMGFPCPVTLENLPEAWKWANRQRRRAKKKLAVRRITSLLLYPYFTVVLFVMVYGSLYDLKDPLISRFFDQWTLLYGLWEKARTLMYHNASPDRLPAIQAALLYLAPLTAAVAVGLLVLLLYHPRSRKPDSSSSQQDLARQLCETLLDARTAAQTRPREMAGFCHTTFAVLGILALIAFLFYCQSDPTAADLFRSRMPESVWYAILAGLGFVWGYRLVRLPLDFGLWLLTFSYLPRRVLPEAELWLEGFGSGEKWAPGSEVPPTECSCPTEH